eukprot:SAG31_NODE_2734_length_5172_cov_2.068007_5_plen_386_part_00
MYIDLSQYSPLMLEVYVFAGSGRQSPPISLDLDFDHTEGTAFESEDIHESAHRTKRKTRIASVLKPIQKMLLREQEMDKNQTESRQERADRLHEEMQSARMLHPMGTFRKRWDLLQVLALAYVASIVPYRIGFSNDTKPFEFWFVFDMFVDLYFVLDLFISFRTAFYIETGELQFRPKQVARRYLQTWFPVDMLSCLPINYVTLYIESLQESKHAGASSEAKSNKFFRMLRLFRLLKLLRLLRLQRIIARYEEEYYGLAFTLSTIKIMLIVIFVGHWLCCVWYFAGTFDDMTFVAADGTVMHGWVRGQFGGNATSDYFPQYLAAIYWSFQTMTTVGYGDYPASTQPEMFAACAAMLIGAGIFGMIVGKLTDLVRKQNPGEKYRSK